MTTNFTLPSGRSATLRRGYGRDFKTAQKMVGDQGDLSFALIAILAKVENQEIDVEAALDLDLADVISLNQRINGMPAAGPGKLPSGRSYVMRSGKGRDLQKAQRLANDQSEVAFGLITTLTTIDGESLFPDALLDMDLPDLMHLITEVQTHVPTQALSTSPS